MRRKKLLAVIIVLLLTVAVTSGVYAKKYADDLTDQKTKYNHSQTELRKRNEKIEHLNQQIDQVKKEGQENDAVKQQQIQQLEEQKKDLEQQLQAKIERKARLAAEAQAAAEKATERVAAAVTAPVASAVSGCGDNHYANYIYMHESGCRLQATNAEGCVGIGQACPASKLTSVCPGLDYACQNQFFTSYAVARYGSWEAAYNVWLNQRWW